MKAFAIVLENNAISEHGYSELVKSSIHFDNDFQVERFNAIDETAAREYMGQVDCMRWAWPWRGEDIDFPTGLIKKAYKTARPYARIGCFLSHYYLWKKCIEVDETILILEHDAIFVSKLNNISIENGQAASINNPARSTRKAELYHQLLMDSPGGPFVPVPDVDDNLALPTGLPGNSAYLMTPMFASKVVEFARAFGMWPNDALLCKQVFPGKLLALKNYATQVQGLPSTTTL
jgi:hypothetical protein